VTTKEVLKGEIVPSGDSPSELSTSRADITPAAQELIRERLANTESDPHWSFSTLARRARIHAPTFIAALHDAVKSPTHPLHEFSLDVFEAWAKREEMLMGKVFEAADAKDKWEGFMTMLERQYSDEWRRPSQSAPTQVTNIGVVQKLGILQQNQGGELTTGD
jgi:hypothetical protein